MFLYAAQSPPLGHDLFPARPPLPPNEFDYICGDIDIGALARAVDAAEASAAAG